MRNVSRNGQWFVRLLPCLCGPAHVNADALDATCGAGLYLASEDPGERLDSNGLFFNASMSKSAFATQRIPLPHISASLPSAFVTFILASTPKISDGSTQSTPSAPDSESSIAH